MATETTQVNTAKMAKTGVISNVGVINCPSTLQLITEQYGSDGDMHWEQNSDFYMLDTLSG